MRIRGELCRTHNPQEIVHAIGFEFVGNFWLKVPELSSDSQRSPKEKD
jgi:hypothetical protein